MVQRLLLRIGFGLLLSGLATPAMAQEGGGRTFRGSFGADLDAWPFGLAFEGGVWIDDGLWMAGAHVRLGALRGQYNPADARVYSAILGSYGVQIGLFVPAKRVRPFILVGYERLGTSLYDAEGFRGGGRTQQALNLEIGGRIADLRGVDLLVGVRGSLGITESTAGAAGPHFPIAALVLTLVI